MTNRTWSFAIAATLSAALSLSACGGDGDAASSAGGAGGAAASGGSAGQAGSGGGGGGGTAGASGAGAGGQAGAAGAGGAAGSGGSGGTTCANDPGPEPNDSEALASPVCASPPCAIGDCDDAGTTGYGGKLAPFTGVVGPGDIDFWRFDGQDKLGFCQVNATAKTAEAGFRICIFPSCAAATKLLGCTKGTMITSPNGIQGCCADAPGEVEAKHDCTGNPTDNDSAEVFVRLDNATACTSYSVDYHF